MVGGFASRSGVYVNQAAAESITAYWRANIIISTTIAQLPFELRRRDRKGNSTTAYRHPNQKIKYFAEGNEITYFCLKEMLQCDAFNHGNGYAYIIHNQAGQPIELHYGNSLDCEAYKDGERVKYHLNINDQSFTAYPEEVIHLHGYGFNGLRAKSPIQVHRENLGEALAVREFGNSFFRNGAHVKAVVEHPLDLSRNARRKIAQKVTDNNQGVYSAGNLLVLDEGMQYKPIGVNPQDAMFIETRQLNVADIARITGVPLHMLESMDKATFNNVEMMSTQFVQYTMVPWCAKWEAEFSRKLLSENERSHAGSSGYYYHFNVDGLLRGDSAARGDFYKLLFSCGALSPNDIRRKEDMPTIEGGDRYFVPTNNLTPLDKLDEIDFGKNVKHGNANTGNAQSEDEPATQAAEAGSDA